MRFYQNPAVKMLGTRKLVNVKIQFKLIIFIQLVQREIRSVLNKLAPQKFDELMKQVDAIELDNKEKMDVTIDLIFEKVCPHFQVLI